MPGIETHEIDVLFITFGMLTVVEVPSSLGVRIGDCLVLKERLPGAFRGDHWHESWVPAHYTGRHLVGTVSHFAPSTSRTEPRRTVVTLKDAQIVEGDDDA
jgi:hypothetical protein